ncbi:ATP-binding protein [Ferrovibrio sp.]|uniref:sensor histidine kinase n=1 Tax=Ferrovibrio sp. TaxID=1917215 RepID=UPI00311D6EC3
MSVIADFFATDGFMPHGVCLLWKPEVFWLHLVSDLLIAASYFAIPAILLDLAIRRTDLVPRGILALFSAFILLCGLTHLFGVWVLWNPDYGVEGLAKAATGVVSLATAAALVPAVRWARLVPGAGQWATLNADLNREIADRRAAEAQVRALNAELELRIRARTAELEEANARLRREIDDRRHAERRFRDVAALSADWIWETDGDLVYTYMSDQVERVTGMAAGEYVGHSRIALFGDIGSDYFLQQHVGDLQARRPFSDFVQWLNRPRGLVCISMSGMPRYDDAGHFIGYIGIGRDVTEEQTQRRRLEEMNEALAAARDQALRASTSKSSFLAHMSHELRTPLNAVLGFSEVMKEQLLGPLEDRYRAYAAHIYDSALHLLSLINDVLDLSKIEAGAYELHETGIELAALAGRAIRQVEAEARRAGIAVALDCATGLPQVRADQRAVFQIYLNLLSNAVKYSAAGGQVRVFARLEENGGIAFGVRDTGIGMTADEIDKALQRFGQVENVMTRDRQGTGLGLPLVRELALLHGGSVEIESEPGEGTIVTVRFGADRVA